jgi:hypothetical protein
MTGSPQRLKDSNNQKEQLQGNQMRVIKWVSFGVVFIGEMDFGLDKLYDAATFYSHGLYGADRT